MNIGIYTNIDRDKKLLVTKRLVEQINKNNFIDYKIVYYSSNQKSKMVIDQKYTQEDFENYADVIVAIGGDGTIIKVVVNASKSQIPVLGINAGNVGFLTELSSSSDNFKNIIDILYQKKYSVENRTLIESEYDGKKILALNEVIICRDSKLHVSNIDIVINNTKADSFLGDGVMLATPTGSTAYSLSCGGPILAPNVNALVINTLCPHILHGRPIVVDDNSEIKLMARNENKSMIIAADGTIISKAKTKQVELFLRKSNLKAKLIKIDNINFYSKVLHKLNYTNQNGEKI